jgi:hypothetical protein
MAPHLTLVFPFDDSISLAHLREQVADVIRDFEALTISITVSVWEAVVCGAVGRDQLSDVHIETGSRTFRLSLSDEQIRAHAWNLVISGMGTTAIAMDKALEEAFGSRPTRDTATSDLDRARIVIYMIRCAFAHNPINPAWQCRDPYVGVFSC